MFTCLLLRIRSMIWQIKISNSTRDVFFDQKVFVCLFCSISYLRISFLDGFKIASSPGAKPCNYHKRMSLSKQVYAVSHAFHLAYLKWTHSSTSGLGERERSLTCIMEADWCANNDVIKPDVGISVHVPRAIPRHAHSEIGCSKVATTVG